MSLFDAKPKLPTTDLTGTILIEIATWPADLREAFFGALGLEPDQQKTLGELLRSSSRVVIPAARDALCEKIEEVYCIGCGETHEDGCSCNDYDEDDEDDEDEGDDDAEEGDEDDDDDGENGDEDEKETGTEEPEG